ncbi:hypothetical protein FEM48_Zijuj01G0069700 [Ziziphus jujuba var. spinosa]|uniref:Glucose-methanol-choline oxidoreductase N-terminal domain-containing protein n=1 Tax=Ziziphus jujuba var. spinosa TaxID=714518 RepID=A0A978VZS7_ZIZJJ|nr:hypothetical protein FEM48_Zijuj01G0069700 [Ziziphus jujuba var. spinosa]
MDLESKMFERGVSASGVVYSDSKGRTHEALIKDEGEVILSAGAIGSPQLLLLSGVGPLPHLSSHKFRLSANTLIFYPNGTTPLELSVATIVEKFSGPLSSGSLLLVSSFDVKVGGMLKIDAMEGLKFEALEGAEGFKILGPSLPSNQSDDASMEAFCRSTVTTFWHYHGGCLVGKVVDGDLYIGLRILQEREAAK